MNRLIKLAQEKIASFKCDGLRSAGFMPSNGDYFPAIYYPPITMYKSSHDRDMFNGFRFDQDAPLCVYIHIPFCPTHCVFCHWTTSQHDTQEVMEHYVDKLGNEIDLWKRKFNVDRVVPRSILIGGGTPTLLTPGLLEKFLKILHAKFSLSSNIQISCEGEPGTLLGKEGRERLRVMKAHGVNRISIGVQSFDDGILKKMARAHDSQDVKMAVQQIRKVGFQSLSMDLIYGLPGMTTDIWLETLDQAFALDIDSCQQYRLRIVPHGDKKGKIKEQYDSTPAQFAELNDVYLWKELGILVASQHGFGEDSRRVFSKNPRHSSEYLKDHTDRLFDVWGIGISSWSNVQGRSFLNTGKGYDDYYSYIDGRNMPLDRGKIRTADDQMRWALVMPLKHLGLNKEHFKANAGVSVHEAFPNRIKRLKEFNLITEDDTTIKLTEKGRFFADEVVIQFYHHDYVPFPRSAYIAGELNPYNP